MGSETTEIALRPQNEITVLMMVGLQGAGVKTPVIGMTPAKVADYAFRGMMKGKAVIIPGIFNFLGRFAPECFKMQCVAAVKRPR